MLNINVPHSGIMDEIDFAGNGSPEEYQLLPDKFPSGILGDGELHYLTCSVRDDRKNIESFPQHGVDCEEVHRIDELYLRFQKPLPGK